MLLQSQNGVIHLLPALPSALPDGEIKGIRARGGFELNFSWKSGKLSRLEILSKAGGDCSLRYGQKTLQFKTVKGGKYQFDGELKKMTSNL